MVHVVLAVGMDTAAMRCAAAAEGRPAGQTVDTKRFFAGM